MKDNTDKLPHALQRAWLAGVLDARLYWPKKAGKILRMETTDEALIKRIHKTCGLGGVTTREKRDCSHLIWVWQTSKMDDTREVLKQILPFLSGRALRQATGLLESIESNPRWRKQNPDKLDNLITQ